MIIESNRVYFEISNWFWAHQNLCPNLDELAKNKNMKPHCRAHSTSRLPPAFSSIRTLIIDQKWTSMKLLG